MNDDYTQHVVDIPVKLYKTDKSIVETLQKFNTVLERPFIVLKEGKTLNKSDKFSKGQILQLDKIFNNSNLEHVANSLHAIPVYSQNKWGGNAMYSRFSDVADAVITNISNAENTGGWPVDKERIKNISAILNEMKEYIPMCTIESGKYVPSDYQKFPSVLISGLVCNLKDINPDGDATTIFYGKRENNFTIDIELKLWTPDHDIAKIEARRRIYTEIALQDLEHADKGDIVMFINALDSYTEKKGIRLRTSEDLILNTLEAAKQNKSLVFSMYDHNQRDKNLNQSLDYFVDIMKGISNGLARASKGQLSAYYKKNFEKALIEDFVK